MLEIYVDGNELYDESKNEFVKIKPQTLKLEHSLLSISKWESKWHKVFLDKSENGKTEEEILDYIKCMTINNVDPYTYYFLSQDDIDKIFKYIEDPMTATIVKDIEGKRSNEKVTSEVIYYWMVSLQIPFECEKWHLNRLLTLIKICNVKNQPSKKMSKRQILEQNRALNAARLKKFHTKG